MNPFQQHFRELLHRARMSQTDYAKATSVDRTHINHLLSGRRKPNYDELLRVQEVFPEVDYNRFFKNEEGNVTTEPSAQYVTTSDKLDMIAYHTKQVQKLTKQIHSDTKKTPSE